MATPIYLVAMTVALLTACWTLGRATAEPEISPRRVCLAIFVILALACLFAVGLGENAFGVMRLACYGLFGYSAVMTAYGAWLMRRKAPRWALAFAAAVLLIEGIAADAFLIEPYWLEVTHQTLVSEKLSRAIRLAIVADLQTDQIGDYEREALARVMAERPDLVLFAGDYLQEYNDQRRAELRAQLRGVLEQLDFNAPLGAFAVGGNADLPDWEEIFVDTPISSTAATRSFDVGPLIVTALSMTDSFRKTTRVPASQKFQIVVGHAPNFALGEVDADLLVAGHTHGGQVRAPWLGPLLTLSLVPRSWAAGTTELGGGRTLIVSRGIGMERGFAPRLRFLCRPQLVIVDLVPKP